jgi:hypothetical protein
MDDSSRFADQFVALLDKTGFPEDLSPEEVLLQVDAVISALTVTLAGFVGTGRIQFKDLVYQGGGGGGGPHRLDLLVGYNIEAARSSAGMPGL